MGYSATIVKQRLRRSAPALFFGSSVAGLFASNILTGVAAYRAANIIRDDRETNPSRPKDRKEEIRHDLTLVWKEFVPASTAVLLTTGTLVSGNRIQANRLGAASAAYAGTQKAFDRYRSAVTEEIGTSRESKIGDTVRTAMAAEADHRSRPSAEGGRVLCVELHTQRYFYCDMETLRKAQNEVNHEVNNTLYCTLDFFYDRVGLRSTTTSDSLGWDSDRLMDLKFTTILTEDGVPTLAFEYNYLKPI